MILIDEAAGSKNLIQHPPLSDPSIAQLERLDFSRTLAERPDVVFPGNGPSGAILVAIEVKSITDLVGSLQSKRLQSKQLPCLIEEVDGVPLYPVRWLLHYGDYRSDPRTGDLQLRRWGPTTEGSRPYWVPYKLGNRVVKYSYPTAFLQSPSFTQLGVGSARVFDLAEAAAWIHTLWKEWSKPWTAHQAVRVLPASNVALPASVRDEDCEELRQDERLRRRATFGNILPGLGFQRALAAARHFGSIREMANADPAEWARVAVPDRKGKSRKIGSVVGKAIDEFLGK